MATFQERYKKSKKGLLYIAPTGSGKTLEALKATRGELTTVIGTASLTKNFAQEEKKWFGTETKRQIKTYSGIARGQKLKPAEHLVLDESQYIRNPNTKTYKNLQIARANFQKVLAMTASPLINEPYDIASQVNLVAGKQVVPINKKQFYELFYKNIKIRPTIAQRFMGVKPGSIRELRDPEDVRFYIGKYVHKADPKKFLHVMPKRSSEIVRVPLGEKQLKIYKYIEGTIPRHLRKKIHANMPVSKQEQAQLNFFMQGLRQVSNTAAPFIKTATLSTKLDRMVDDLQEELANKGRVITYSNYIGAGLERFKQRLNKRGIPFSELTGKMSKADRTKAIKRFNTQNKTNVFLISSAGSEGINAPATMVQLMETHFNAARLHQAASRGIRRGDDPSKTVRIKTYISTIPKKKAIFGFPNIDRTPRTSSGEYLLMMSNRKQRENQEFLRALTYRK